MATGETTFVYSGLPQGPASATVTGSTGIVTYSYAGVANNEVSYGPSLTAPINAGTYSMTATVAEDNNHFGATSNPLSFIIGKASSETVVSIVGGPFTYTGSAITPAIVKVTGAGGLNLTPQATYINNINAGTATASYTYSGDANHTGSSGSNTFIIGKASSTTSITIKQPLTYNNCPQGGTVKVTGVNGVILTPTPIISYSGIAPTKYGPSTTAPTNAGSYAASATFIGNINYNSSSALVTFYINPGGKTAKKIRTYLRCISDKVAGEYFGYTAVFGYINDNTVPVYIPIGTENVISPLSAIDPSYKQPELFLPGSHEFQIKFTGANITWTVTSYDSNHKTSTTSGATLSSPKCSSTKSAEITTDIETTNIQDRELKAYPNPTNGRVTINFVEDPGVNDVMVLDILGRTLQVEKLWIPTSGLEINLSGVGSGIYIIKVNNKGIAKSFRIVKE